jgi:hypothetical protein
VTDIWGPAAVAALVGLVTSALVSVWGVSRNIKHKSVIEERQRWRDSLRELVPIFTTDRDKMTRRAVRNSIALHLNPYGDAEAVRVLDQFQSKPTSVNAEAVVSCFQDILKRDWERSKIEASLWPFRARARAEKAVDAQKSRFGQDRFAR